jgi:hypothetical protein
MPPVYQRRRLRGASAVPTYPLLRSAILRAMGADRATGPARLVGATCS